MLTLCTRSQIRAPYEVSPSFLVSQVYHTKFRGRIGRLMY